MKKKSARVLNTKKRRTAPHLGTFPFPLKCGVSLHACRSEAGGVGGRTPNKEHVTAEAGSAGGDTFLCPSMSATPDLWSPHKAV